MTPCQNDLLGLFQAKDVDSTVQCSVAESELLSHCNKNLLSKAMLVMHVAGNAVASKSHVATERQAQLLQVDSVPSPRDGFRWGGGGVGTRPVLEKLL